MRFLRSGSDEYYKLEEEADNIHRCRANATTTIEREKWIEQGKELTRQMYTEYGRSDKMVKGIVESHECVKLFL